MDSLVIAFGYEARSGKDTAVKTIIEERGGKPYDIRRYGFGDFVKQEVNDAIDDKLIGAGRPIAPSSAMQELCRWAGVEYDPNPDMTDPLCPYGKQRNLLQWWGTEYRRAQDKDYWVRKMQARLEDEKPKIALINDMRFLNEFAWVIDPMGVNGKVCRVDRLGYKKELQPHQQNHRSETELRIIPDKDWHYIIQVPDGHLDELKKDALYLYDHFVESQSPPDIEVIEKEIDDVYRLVTAQGVVNETHVRF